MITKGMTVEAVFFDVGGTLLEVSPSVGHVYAAACRERGTTVDPLAVQRSFDEAWVSLSAGIPRGADRYRHFDGGEGEWWDRVSSLAFDACGVPAASRPPLGALRAVFSRPGAWSVYPEAQGALELLAGRGLRLGVISNWDSRLPALLAALGLDGYFESIICSAAAGCEKPHPDIFRAALSRLDVDPQRSVHIGDRIEDDYNGAREAGMNGLLLDRDPRVGGLRGEMERSGHTADIVADLAEAAARIVERT